MFSQGSPKAYIYLPTRFTHSVRPCGHGFCGDCARERQQLRGTCCVCVKPIEKIVGLSARMSTNGAEEIDLDVPVVLLDMKDYPTFRSLRAENSGIDR